MEIATIIILIILLFGVAFFYSNLGLGGGVLNVPILLHFTGMPIMQVAPISLTFAFAIGLSSAVNHGKKGLIDFKIGPLLVAGAVIGAIIGSLFTINVNQAVVIFLLVVVLIAVWVKMMYEIIKGKKEAEEDDLDKQTAARKGMAAGGATGIGFVSSSMGLGGGVVAVPLQIYLLGMKTRKAMGTSLFIMIFTTMVGFLTYYFSGVFIDFVLIAILLPVVFVGAFIGSRWGLESLKTPTIKAIFVMLVLVAAVKMVIELVGLI